MDSRLCGNDREKIGNGSENLAQGGAVATEPDFGGAAVIGEGGYQSPKAGAVVHLGQMSDFVGNNIIQNKQRGEAQTPAKI